VCEDCLGPNPYIRMQKQDYAAECAISSRPFTVFRWRPGNEARYKKTVVCREIALAKNVCQVCLLDLDYGIPVQARDAVLGRERETVAKSDVNIEFHTNEIAKRIENGEDVQATARAEMNSMIQKLARKKPYYQKNKAPICTFWLRNACNRPDCPYRPCNGDTNMPELTSAPELRTQNIKDRYYGINDPVAEKMLKRASEKGVACVPPEDKSITTLFIGGMDERVTEGDLKDTFYAYGEIKSIRCVHAKNCGFVTFTDRAGAEKAAEALSGDLVINNLRLKLMWGKPRKPREDGGGGGGGGDGRAAAAAGQPAAMPMLAVPPPAAAEGTMMMQPMMMPAPYAPPTIGGKRGAVLYPSMDPSAMGTVYRKQRDEEEKVEKEAGKNKRARKGPAGESSGAE